MQWPEHHVAAWVRLRLHSIAGTARALQSLLASPAWRLVMISGVLLPLCACSSDRHLSFLNPQGPIAAAERTHFLWVVGILIVFVAVPIFAFLPWVLWRFRYRATSSPYSPGWKANLPLEIFTWTGPILIVIALGFMLWHYSHALDPYKKLETHAQDPITVQAIGYDWKWLFIYPKQGIASVGVMAIPTNTPVAMKITSATVMQSLHIPALVSQIYAMGGMVTQLHFEATQPGRSLGENNMYNGQGFHEQRFTAVAMSPDAFKGWVEQARQRGMPLNTRTYKVLTQRNTVAQLTTALPRATYNGNVFLTHVSPALFAAVIKHIKTEKNATLDQVLKNANAASPAAPEQASAARTEETP